MYNSSKDGYRVRGELVNCIERKIQQELKECIDRFDGTYGELLQCILVNIEQNLLDGKRAESIDNFCRRCTSAFLICNIGDKLEGSKFSRSNAVQQNFYNTILFPQLSKIAQDYRTLLEIKDGNSFAKSNLEHLKEGTYQLVTSLVSDKYNEATLYFHGYDDIEQAKAEQKLIHDGIVKFALKYGLEKQKIKMLNRLHIDIDLEVLRYCESAIRKDISKLGDGIRSDIFKNVDQLTNMLGFLYYLAFVHKNKCQILTDIGVDIPENEYLMVYPKQWVISKINKLYGINEFAIEKFLNYLVNQATNQLLEFPIFEQDSYIFTIPSLIMVNDWQFTLVNGHYYKNVSWKNKHKTISVTIANKINRKLSSKENIRVAREKYYEFVDKEGKVIKSDIDLALYDINTNQLLIVEAKWKENHYYNEMDIRYKKIEDTLNKIYGEQLSKHKEYLKNRNNILDVFEEYEDVKEILRTNDRPYICYIAIDKRNQLHIENKHMITEFMLAYFIDEYSDDKELRLNELIGEIESLNTKVEYFNIDDEKIINLSQDIGVNVDSADLTLDYK